MGRPTEPERPAPEDVVRAAEAQAEQAEKLIAQVRDEAARVRLEGELARIRSDRADRTFRVVVFGTGSAGKTSLINALLGTAAGAVEATMGTTRHGTTYTHAVEGLDGRLELIDTPGLSEVGEAGAWRESEARDLAARSDLLLFVVDHDLTRSEFDPLAALARQGKRAIVVLNKKDRFPEADREAILSRLRERLRGIVPSDEVVAVAAAPRPTTVRVKNPDGSIETIIEVEPPDLADLEDRIARIVEAEGDDLRAANLLLRAHLVGREAQERLTGERRAKALAVVEKFQWITAGTVFTNPIPALDLMATGAVQFQMISEIAAMLRRRAGAVARQDDRGADGPDVAQARAGRGRHVVDRGRIQIQLRRLRRGRRDPGDLDGLSDPHLRLDVPRLLRARPVVGRRRPSGRARPPVRSAQPGRLPPRVRRPGSRSGRQAIPQHPGSGGAGTLSTRVADVDEEIEPSCPSEGARTGKMVACGLRPSTIHHRPFSEKPMSDPESSPIDEVIATLHRQAASPDDDAIARARESLEQTIQGLKLNPDEERALAEELGQLRDLAAKLDAGTVEIAAFGMVSRGKSSVLNALGGRDVFAVGATHGTTQARGAHPWESATLSDASGFTQAKLVLVDTPGIDEVGGEGREVLAREVARHADLILFVVSGDLQRVEFEALERLREANKPILLVFNQIDRYPDADRDAIYAKITNERVRSLIRPEDVVMTAARPDPVKVRVRHPDGRTTDDWERPEPLIEPLKRRILEVLEREGKAIVALNTLLYAGDLHQEIVARKMRLREERADDAIWKFAIAKGAAVALNPVPVADLAGGLAVDVTMIVALSRVYGIPLTRQTAASLVRDMVVALGAVGVVKVAGHLLVGGMKSVLAGITVLSGGLAAPLTALGYGAIGLAQGAAAAAVSYVLGQGAKVYLRQACQWGPRGIRTVLHEILREAKTEGVVDRLKDDLKRKVRS